MSDKYANKDKHSFLNIAATNSSLHSFRVLAVQNSKFKQVHLSSAAVSVYMHTDVTSSSSKILRLSWDVTEFRRDNYEWTDVQGLRFPWYM